MSMSEEIKKKLKEIVGDMRNLPLQGQVNKVSDETCDVKLTSGLIIKDIRLKATVNSSTNHLILKPKKNTNVLIASITGDLDDLYLAKIDEVESIEYVQDGLTVFIDSTDGKVQIKNNLTSLIDLFTGVYDAINQLTVATNIGPSGTPLPPTIQAIAQLNMKTKQLLK